MRFGIYAVRYLAKDGRYAIGPARFWTRRGARAQAKRTTHVMQAISGECAVPMVVCATYNQLFRYRHAHRPISDIIERVTTGDPT